MRVIPSPAFTSTGPLLLLAAVSLVAVGFVRDAAAAPPAQAPTASIDWEAARDHWAFRPLQRMQPPAVADDHWSHNAIDRFILARLAAADLSPSPPADRATLIRRVYFDLIGLPPTPEQVANFVADPSPDAYEKPIDRLLASPHYGERWGRHWLDLARYADSSGFHDDLDRPNAWRYRDYVIASFNDDKPYGQFIREQIAGDELDPASLEAWIATGFCRNGPSNENNVKPAFREQYRLDQLDDVIATTATVFLGVTIGCARCHDHKTDPIPQADYYRVLAVFNTAEKRQRPLTPDGSRFAAGKADDSKKKKKGPAVMALTDAGAKPRKTHVLLRGSPDMPGPEVGPGVPKALAHLAPVSFTPPPPEARTTGRRLAFADWVASPDNALTWRVMANRLWQHHFGRGIVASSDNFGTHGDRPTHPQLLDWLAGQLIAHGGRLKPVHKLIMMSGAYRQASSHDDAAARRDPDNTLIWRMNKRRLEAEVIRDSVLAVSGRLNPAMGGPGVKPRLPHEIIEQSQRNKWPKVDREGPEHWRRSVYIYVKRQLLMPMMELFDAPTASVSCSRRTVSTIPTQALTMLNGRFVNEQAAAFARRVIERVGDDPRAQAMEAIAIALSRPASQLRESSEVKEAVQFLQGQRAMHQSRGVDDAEAAHLALTDFAVVLMNTSQFVYVD